MEGDSGPIKNFESKSSFSISISNHVLKFSLKFIAFVEDHNLCLDFCNGHRETKGHSESTDLSTYKIQSISKGVEWSGCYSRRTNLPVPNVLFLVEK